MESWIKKTRRKHTAEKKSKEKHPPRRIGCFSLVLEHIPELLAKEIQNNCLIGIGAGNCDGQVELLQIY